jgi:hypothetical protein
MWRKKSSVHVIAVWTLLVLCGWPGAPSTVQAAPLPPFPGFTPELPPYWDCPKPVVVPRRSEAVVKRLLDIFSWKELIAVTWPGVYDHDTWKPQPDGEVLRWESWRQSAELFKEDGSAPEMNRTPPALHRLESDGIDQDEDRTVDPLWDQNGEKVYYETRLNAAWVDFAIPHKLYSAAGQREYRSLISFQHGQCKNTAGRGFDNEGAVELRLAWKIMGGGDQRARFYRKTVRVPDKADPVEVGLVGLHINHKTLNHPEWIWSTFEHIDNVRGNPLGEGRRSLPSFYNPACPACATNKKPTEENGLCDATGVCRTQVTRGSAIPADTAALNTQVQHLLRARGSLWQYYELIGTQYRSPNTGKLTPRVLRNSVMETYLPRSNCLGCHGKAKIADGRKDADGSFLLRKAR